MASIGVVTPPSSVIVAAPIVMVVSGVPPGGSPFKKKTQLCYFGRGLSNESHCFHMFLHSLFKSVTNSIGATSANLLSSYTNVTLGGPDLL